MQLIWRGILLFDFLPSVKFSGRGFLPTLLMLLMMRAAILHGVHRDLLNLDSSEETINLWRVIVDIYSLYSP